LIRFMFFPVLLLVKNFLQKRSMLISVDNLFAIGHIYPEIDELIRFLHQHENQNLKIIYAYPSTKLISKEIFCADRLILIESGLWHCCLVIIAMCEPSLSISMAHSVVSCINQRDASVREVFLVRQVRAAFRKRQHATYFPLRNYGDANRFPDDLRKLVGPPGSYVVVQIKDYAVNGTWKAVDPLSYEDAFGYLITKGYSIVLGGRESYPSNFRKFGVIDFANSCIASALTDYWLVYGAKLVVGSASGFCLIPEALDKPLVSINSWQHIPYIGRKTINIPSRLVVNSDPLSFKQQLKFLLSGETSISGDSSASHFSVVDASSKEILEGIKEIFAVIEGGTESIPLSVNQEKIKELYFYTLAGTGQSTVSEFFLKRHKKYFFKG